MLTNLCRHRGHLIAKFAQSKQKDAVVNSVRRLPAVLRGMGIESNCTLEIWQERSSSGRDFTRCHIVDEPPFLPDGAYQLFFAGHTVNTRKTFGVWELTFLSPEMDLSGGNWASDPAC